MPSPYDSEPPCNWLAVTKTLIDQHPLKPSELVEAVLMAWKLIFTDSVIGGKIKIGVDVFPQPQILGDFLHELIPLLLEEKYPQLWRRDRAAGEKDLVYLPDKSYSIEIKTSSSPKGIFGNRSFSQASVSRPQKKDKSGYYLAVNYPPVHKQRAVSPITMIRFGWLDHEDWQGQAAASGQQASLSPQVLEGKLLIIHRI